MTTYADGFDLRDADVVNGNDIADAVDGLRATTAFAQRTSLTSTTSLTFVPMADMSVSLTVTDTQSVYVSASVMLSHGTAGQPVGCALYRDDVALTTNFSWMAIGNKTDGREQVSSLVAVDDQPGAGTHVYTLQWAVAAGTGYAYRGSIAALALEAL